MPAQERAKSAGVWLSTLWRTPRGRVGFSFVALLAAGLIAWTVAVNRPIRVAVAQVRQSVPVRVFGLGTVEARVLSKVGFEVGATLVELKADHGDRVSKGDVLARLNAGEQEAKVAKARAALKIAEVNIDKTQAAVEKARAVLAQKQEANRRKQSLVGRQVISEQTAEEALRDEAVARADVAVAVSEAEASKAQLADARAQLQFEETMFRHRTLVAPFDAMVVERLKEAGSVIKAGDPIYTLVAPESVWGLAYVDEARAGHIQEGQEAQVRLRSLPQQTLAARVVRIGIESDRVNEERRVWVKCLQCPGRFHLGEQAEIFIKVADLPRALLVREAAVKGFDGRTGQVWTVEAGRLQRRTVSFGHRTEDSLLEITDGLPKDARVVNAIVPGMREGRAVRIAEGGGK
jgi:HlyD family secretion protein